MFLIPLFQQLLRHASRYKSLQFVSLVRSTLRVASLRQLSNNFAQFNNVQIPLRSRKPLTRKVHGMNQYIFVHVYDVVGVRITCPDIGSYLRMLLQ
jgi:hypothetical protein